MPPFSFYFDALFFSIFGFSLRTVRTISLLFGIGTVGLVSQICSRFGLTRFQSILIAGLLFFDPLFLRGALVGRMDMMSLFFGVLAIYLYDRSSLELFGQNKIKLSLLITSGIFSALAFLTHPFGLIIPTSIVLHLLLIRRKVKFSSLFLLVNLIVVSPWLVSIAQHWPAFVEQFGAQLRRKEGGISVSSLNGAINIMIQNYQQCGVRSIWAKFSVNIMLVFSLMGVLSLLRKASVWGLFYILALVMYIKGHEMWYTIWVLPPVLISSVFLVIDKNKLTLFKKFFLIPAIISIFVININLHLIDKYPILIRADLDRQVDRIADLIRPNSVVFLNSIPDPYFQFKEKRPDLKLRAFLPDRLSYDPAAYKEFILGADYIVADAGGLGLKIESMLKATPPIYQQIFPEILLEGSLEKSNREKITFKIYKKI